MRATQYAITEDTVKGIVIGSGMSFKNFPLTFTSADDVDALMEQEFQAGNALGAIDGGWSWKVSITYERPSIDGIDGMPFKGLEYPASAEMSQEMTIKEISADKLQNIYGTSDFAMEENGNIISQAIRLGIDAEDYMDNVTTIFTTSYGYALFVTKNVLGMASGATSFPKGVAGAGIPFAASANFGSMLDRERLPVEIIYAYDSAVEAENIWDRLDDHRKHLSTNT